MSDVQLLRVAVTDLLHIEGWSLRRVEWLERKIRAEGVWTKPLALDDTHGLVLDGQHRMEVAKRLGLSMIPAVRFPYRAVRVWSLRPKYSFDWRLVTERALEGRPYPYKTVKHGFPSPLPSCSIALEELRP